MHDHRRFTLRDVRLAGVSVGGATIDTWRDREGTFRWCARLLIPANLHVSGGRLDGTTADGRRLGGLVQVAGALSGPGGRRQVLAELHGQGPLEVASTVPGS